MCDAWMRAASSLRHAHFLLFHVMLEMLSSSWAVASVRTVAANRSWPFAFDLSQLGSKRMSSETGLVHAYANARGALGQRSSASQLGSTRVFKPSVLVQAHAGACDALGHRV